MKILPISTYNSTSNTQISLKSSNFTTNSNTRSTKNDDYVKISKKQDRINKLAWIILIIAEIATLILLIFKGEKIPKFKAI
jgi:hypothetical protein